MPMTLATSANSIAKPEMVGLGKKTDRFCTVEMGWNVLQGPGRGDLMEFGTITPSTPVIVGKVVGSLGWDSQA